MGIGNSAQATFGASRSSTLITPHGDRKHQIGQVGNELEFSLLITPHGDRKPRDCPPRSRRPSHPHYPSWGSETVCVEIDSRHLPNSHYPSWGSETGALAIVVGGAVLVSLPLMGIGNRRGHQPCRRAGILITPHGDRKPLGGGLFHCGSLLLITPHGDRKPHARRTWTRPTDRLITLHGDRKLPLGSWVNSCLTVLITPHGDRKQLGGGPIYLGFYGLITPHGDRKPSGSRYRGTTTPTAHYPSWGSETQESATGALDPVDSSLPLMGIGNDEHVKIVARGPRPHYPSWGSETYPLRHGAAVSQLITPHGDRKPLPGLGAHKRGAARSLPLMGIGNTLPSHPHHWRAAPHYPSWGSETRAR